MKTKYEIFKQNMKRTACKHAFVLRIRESGWGFEYFCQKCHKTIAIEEDSQ